MNTRSQHSIPVREVCPRKLGIMGVNHSDDRTICRWRQVDWSIRSKKLNATVGLLTQTGEEMPAAPLNRTH